MMTSKSKYFSLTSAMWICLILGGVAVSFTAGQDNDTTTIQSESSDTTPTASSDLTTSGLENGTTVPENTSSTEAPGGNATTVTAEPPQNTTIFNGTTEPPQTSTPSNPNATTATSPEVTSHSSSPRTSPATSPKTTQQPGGNSGRKFDVASFFGGAATAVGVTIIVFVLVRCYTNSRKTRYHAM